MHKQDSLLRCKACGNKEPCGSCVPRWLRVITFSGMAAKYVTFSDMAAKYGSANACRRGRDTQYARIHAADNDMSDVEWYRREVERKEAECESVSVNPQLLSGCKAH